MGQPPPGESAPGQVEIGGPILDDQDQFERVVHVSAVPPSEPPGNAEASGRFYDKSGAESTSSIREALDGNVVAWVTSRSRGNRPNDDGARLWLTIRSRPGERERAPQLLANAYGYLRIE